MNGTGDSRKSGPKICPRHPKLEVYACILLYGTAGLFTDQYWGPVLGQNILLNCHPGERDRVCAPHLQPRLVGCRHQRPHRQDRLCQVHTDILPLLKSGWRFNCKNFCLKVPFSKDVYKLLNFSAKNLLELLLELKPILKRIFI